MRKLVGPLLLALLAPLLPAADAATPASCDGNEPLPETTLETYAFTGSFDTSLEGAYVMVPFEVPGGATRVHLRFCYDSPPTPLSAQLDHTLDLGLYEPARKGPWGPDEFRGWGGSSRPEVVVTPQGTIGVTGPAPEDGATTTVGYKPGPIRPGWWAAEIGVASVIGPEKGDPDGSVAWRLEVHVGADPQDADEPWRAYRYDTRPAIDEPGWYKGDFHVHARHSNPADATMESVFDHAFGSRATDDAGLDFITLSDYVSNRAWDELGWFQRTPWIPDDKLVVRSSEVITYRGHINNHASGDLVDHRAGPVYRLDDDGSLTLLREASRRTARDILADIHASGRGWTQVNHPTTFPSTVPGFDDLCRGCSWEYPDAETDWSRVDAFEVQTGPAGYFEPKGDEPGPNPFTPLAIEWWDRLRRAGHDITAVGSSDSHRADHQELTQSPIGEATTVAYADELSETGIREAVLAGHAYVKFFASDGPDLRLAADTDADGAFDDAIMGDEVPAGSILWARVFFEAEPRFRSEQPRELVILRDGVPVLTLPLGRAQIAEGFTLEWAPPLPGDYRLQLHRGTAIEALTNPITVGRV